MNSPGKIELAAPRDSVRRQLDRLLAPVSFAELLDRYWGRSTNFEMRGDPGAFTGLPTEQEFEHLLASLTAPESGWFSLVKERARPPDASFLTAAGWLNLSDVYSAYRDGHSLLLNQVQKRHSETGRLCRLLEMGLAAHGVVLSGHVGANLYLSPAQSRGFSTHYDPHDVLVLQLAGTKHWHVYERRFPLPVVPPDAPFTAEEAGPVAHQFALSPGDWLYIPRGVLHDAYTSDTNSLHLTLSIETATWRDLFADMLENDPQFRESLPVGFTRFRASEQDLAIRQKVRALEQSQARGSAISSIRTRLLAKLDRLPGAGPGRCDAHASIDGDTRLALNEGIFGEVVETENDAILHLPGTSLTASPHMAETFRYLLSQPSFRARDLPVDAALDQKVEFLRGLAVDSLIVQVASGCKEIDAHQVGAGICRDVD